MKITQTIENAIYGYNPQEFMPVFRDGEVDNRGEFVAYKAEQMLKGLGHFVNRSVIVAVDVLENAVQQSSRSAQ